MRTQKDFDEYYDSHIRHNNTLEKTRTELLRWLRPAIVLSVAAAVVIIYVVGDLFEWPTIALILTGCVMMNLILLLRPRYDAYNKNFKNQIISKLIEFIQEELTYKANEGIDQDRLRESQLYDLEAKNAYDYSGHDLIEGNILKTRFSFSALQMYKVGEAGFRSKAVLFSSILVACLLFGCLVFVVGSNQPESLGTLFCLFFLLILVVSLGWGFRNMKKNNIFKGIFFAAAFNKNFAGKTFIFWNEILSGRAENGSRGKLVTLEDPRFSSEFKVYSDDQVEARYILSPVLMERILKLQAEAKARVELSFVNSTVFVAISTKEDLFQAKMFTAALDKEMIQRYFYYLQLAVGIVEELNLNTRIWTRA